MYVISKILLATQWGPENGDEIRAFRLSHINFFVPFQFRARWRSILLKLSRNMTNTKRFQPEIMIATYKCWHRLPVTFESDNASGNAVVADSIHMSQSTAATIM